MLGLWLNGKSFPQRLEPAGRLQKRTNTRCRSYRLPLPAQTLHQQDAQPKPSQYQQELRLQDCQAPRQLPTNSQSHCQVQLTQRTQLDKLKRAQRKAFRGAVTDLYGALSPTRHQPIRSSTRRQLPRLPSIHTSTNFKTISTHHATLCRHF